MTGCQVSHPGHATCLIEIDGAVILTDPLLRRRLFQTIDRICPQVNPARLPAVDIVLISHLHHDHCDPWTLKRIPGRPLVIAPAGTGDFLHRHGLPSVEIGIGNSIECFGLTIAALPVVHPGERVPMGPHGEALAYEIKGSRTLYFAGDTDYFESMRPSPTRLDLAFLPISGWGAAVGRGHLNPRSAARAAAQLKPRWVIPIHWGAYRQRWLPRAASADRDPVAKFRSALAELAPGVDLAVLPPGSNSKLRV